ncbi:MAG: DUF998 domain-containing protein [Bacteroidia bacterium]
MKYKRYAWFGFIAPAIFVITYLIMAGIRPEYSHYTKTISELGSVDAFNRHTWNIIGYILVGGMISIFGFGLYKGISRDTVGVSKVPMYGLVLSGLFMVLAGLFPANFEAKNTFSMFLHTVSNIGAFFSFYIAAYTLPPILKRTYFWQPARIPSIALAVISTLAGFYRPVDMPGIGQRIGYLFFFIWIGYMAFMLWKYGEEVAKQDF